MAHNSHDWNDEPYYVVLNKYNVSIGKDDLPQADDVADDVEDVALWAVHRLKCGSDRYVYECDVKKDKYGMPLGNWGEPYYFDNAKHAKNWIAKQDGDYDYYFIV